MDADNLRDPAVTAILLHRCELPFSNLADEFRNDPAIDNNIKESVDRSVKEFKRLFRRILAFDQEQRKTALDACGSALLLGAMMAIRPRILNGAIGVINKVRLRAAHTSREPIQQIIEQRARILES